MKIAAIGGGDKQPILQPITDSLDNPDILIIPSACSTPASYLRKVPACVEYFTKGGLRAEVLHDFQDTPSRSKVEDSIGGAALIYVIGGNTPHLLETTAAHGTDVAVTDAVISGKTWLAGTSAGALWPFALGQSCPVARPAEVAWDYTYLKGLGLIDAAFGAHANKIDPHLTESDRLSRVEYLAQSLPHEAAIAFAAENDAALVIRDSEAYVARATPQAQLHVIEQNPEGSTHRPLDDTELTSLLGKIGCLR